MTEYDELAALERGLWRGETRFDRAHMEAVLAPEFFEFGRSGRVYRREDTLAVPAGDFAARLHDLRITALGSGVRLVTYVSEVDGEWGNRASIWVRSDGTWRLAFHQGTPTTGSEPLALHRGLGDGIVLRPLEPADAEELHALITANRDHLRPWMPWAGQDAHATAEFLALAVAEAQRRTALHLAIILDGAIGGTCGMHSVLWRPGRAELGYWIDRRAQGRGVVGRAVTALLDHAFDELGLHRIELRAAPDNARSRALAERLGFAFEGVLREAERFPARFGDSALYSMLAAGWAARRNA